MNNETGVKLHTEVKVKPHHVRYIRTLIRDKSTFNDANRQDTDSSFRLVTPVYWGERPANKFEKEVWGVDVVYECSKCGTTTHCGSDRCCHECGAEMKNKRFK